MQNGTSFHWIAEEAKAEQTAEGKIRFANNPLNSTNTQLVAAALTSGFNLVEPGGFRDTVEQTERGPLRRVEWFIDGASRGTFKTPSLGDEEIEFPEFRRRFESEDWCLANPHHPIAFLRWAFRAHGQLRDRIRELKPAALLRRGNRQVTIPAGLPEDKRQKLLSYLQ
jgi:hypothetical protein